jgi:alpha-1,2-mannosyltransferase
MARRPAVPLWSGLSPLARGLACFTALYIALSFVQYYVVGHVSTLNFTRQFLLWHRLDAEDSWEPMQYALQYFLSGGNQSMYEAVFFEQMSKFQYPPLSLVLIWPFAKLPYHIETSNITLNVTSWFAVLMTAVATAAVFTAACRRHLPAERSSRWPERPLLWGITAVLTFSYLPIVHAYHFGQIQTWINCLFAVAVLAWLSERKGLAGFIGALICVIKPQLGLLLVWGVLRREWKFTLWFAGAGLIFMVLSVAIFGLDNNLDYLRVLSFLTNHGESLILNQSFNGFLNRLLHNGTILFDEYVNLPPGAWVPPYNRWIHIGTLASTVLIIGVALFWRAREHRGASLTDFMIMALSLTVSSPIAWTYHYGLLLPMFAVALPATLASGRMGNGALVVLIVAFVLTGSFFFNETEPFAYTPLNPIISYMYFGGLLLLWHLYRLRRAQYQEDRAQAPAIGREPAAVGS